jgi:uncharacterized protein (DUF433 family)
VNTEELIRNVDGDLFVGSSRVLLYNLVLAHRQGQSPEAIRASYPTLPLAQVYGALVYYIEHQEALDAVFAEDARMLDELHAANYAANKPFVDAMRARIEAARAHQGDESAQSVARHA